MKQSTEVGRKTRRAHDSKFRPEESAPVLSRSVGLLPVGRGSKPARLRTACNQHQGRAEFFALPVCIQQTAVRLFSSRAFVLDIRVHSRSGFVLRFLPVRAVISSAQLGLTAGNLCYNRERSRKRLD